MIKLYASHIYFNSCFTQSNNVKYYYKTIELFFNVYDFLIIICSLIHFKDVWFALKCICTWFWLKKTLTFVLNSQLNNQLLFLNVNNIFKFWK